MNLVYQFYFIYFECNNDYLKEIFQIIMIINC